MKLITLRRKVGRKIRNFRRRPGPSFGFSLQDDIRTRLPNWQVRTVFDVGANIGMTALEFSDEFPDAAVYAFEPNAENLRQMRANLIGKPEVLTQMLALGAMPGTGHLLLNPDHPSTHRLVSSDHDGTETVSISTVDQFSADKDISQIDIMKIDVEGHELDVLAGAKRMLAASGIGIVKLECAVDPDSSFHTQFSDICEALHPHGYRLFAIYDQCEDFMTPIQRRIPKLTRFDCAFISPSLQKMIGRTVDIQDGK